MRQGNDRRRAAIDDDELWRYVRPDGRLAAMPRRREPRLRLLAHLAQRFEQGREYGEAEVNAILGGFDPDFAALRRYLGTSGCSPESVIAIGDLKSAHPFRAAARSDVVTLRSRGTSPGRSGRRTLLLGVLVGALATGALGLVLGPPLLLTHRDDLPFERAYAAAMVSLVSRLQAGDATNPLANDPRAIAVGRNAYTGNAPCVTARAAMDAEASVR